MLNIVDRGGQGENLIMLHGFLGSGEDWRAIWPELGRYFRCLTVDLPGHGKSSSGATSFVEIVRQLHGELRGCHLLPANMLGYSLGGRVAMAFADMFPRGVRKLFLEGAHPGLLQRKQRQQRWLNDRHWANRFFFEPLTTVLQDWYQQPVFTSLTEVQRQSLIHERSDNEGWNLADILLHCSLAIQPDRRGLLKKKAESVVYLAGEYDSRFLSLARDLCICSGISTATVPNAGHNAHRDNPLGFVDALTSFDLTE